MLKEASLDALGKKKNYFFLQKIKLILLFFPAFYPVTLVITLSGYGAQRAYLKA
jgi:hypothetical protein